MRDRQSSYPTPWPPATGWAAAPPGARCAGRTGRLRRLGRGVASRTGGVARRLRAPRLEMARPVLSHRGLAAVDEEAGARDVGRLVRGQEEDAGGDFTRRPRPLEHRAAPELRLELLERLASRLGAPFVEAGEDRPRAHGIDPDPLRGVIAGHRAREPGDRRLGGVILRHVVARHRGPDGGDVHDAAATRPAHLRDGRLRAEGVALEVHAEDRVPALLARVDDRLVEPHAGVVDQHVEPTELLAGAPDEADGLGLAFGVRLDEDGADALGPDLVRDAAPPVHVEIGDGDLRALLGEEPRRCLADARGPARDRRHLSAKPSHSECAPQTETTPVPRADAAP